MSLQSIFPHLKKFLFSQLSQLVHRGNLKVSPPHIGQSNGFVIKRSLVQASQKFFIFVEIIYLIKEEKVDCF